mmetsp:Transcript_5354/g.13179  ORF Transcript_5354/g.13179 Transcript_5354/m.13179 type:complete len:201 (+) Transcript_5354:1218-1820(+)
MRNLLEHPPSSLEPGLATAGPARPVGVSCGRCPCGVTSWGAWWGESIDTAAEEEAASGAHGSRGNGAAAAGWGSLASAAMCGDALKLSLHVLPGGTACTGSSVGRLPLTTEAESELCCCASYSFACCMSSLTASSPTSDVGLTVPARANDAAEAEATGDASACRPEGVKGWRALCSMGSTTEGMCSCCSNWPLVLPASLT